MVKSLDDDGPIREENGVKAYLLCISGFGFASFGVAARVDDIPLSSIGFGLRKWCGYGVRVSHMGYP